MQNSNTVGDALAMGGSLISHEDTRLDDAVKMGLTIGPLSNSPTQVRNNVLELVAHRFAEEIQEAYRENDIELGGKLTSIYKRIRDGM